MIMDPVFHTKVAVGTRGLRTEPTSGQQAQGECVVRGSHRSPTWHVILSAPACGAMWRAAVRAVWVRCRPARKAKLARTPARNHMLDTLMQVDIRMDMVMLHSFTLKPAIFTSLRLRTIRLATAVAMAYSCRNGRPPAREGEANEYPTSIRRAGVRLAASLPGRQPTSESFVGNRHADPCSIVAIRVLACSVPDLRWSRALLPRRLGAVHRSARIVVRTSPVLSGARCAMVRASAP
jgi:hypothetical protein